MTKSNNLLSVAIAAIIVLILSLSYIKCNHPSTQPKPSSDSLRTALEIQKFQTGKEIAILLNENTKLNQDKQKLADEKEAILKREKQLAVENKALVKKIREIAPIECDTFINEIVNSYESLIAVKDSAMVKVEEEKRIEEEKNANLVSVIALKDTIAKADSTIIVGLKQDNATKNKQVKRAKLGTRIIAGLAILAMAISWGVSLGS
jgi:hypothetical protein